jgi:predicted RNA-binding Zn-ribbon protein involved in translation (DUF1610 family)
MSARRCPNCGGLVTADVEWCGQCFARLGPATAEREEGPEEAPSATEAVAQPETVAGESSSTRASSLDATSSSAVPGIRVIGEDRVVWDCPVCGQENELGSHTCSRCLTEFGRLFAEPEPPPRISPQRAAVLSLVVPGAGHVAAGRVADGLARAVVFAFTLGMVVAILTAGGGLGGPFFPLVVLFVGASTTLYMATAVDAYRAVRREPPLVSTRILLIGAAGLLLVAMAVLLIGGPRVP